MIYMIDYTIPSNNTASNLVESLTNWLQLSNDQALTYTIKSTNSAAGTQVVEVTFPDQPTQQRAQNMPTSQQQQFNIINSAPTEAPASSTTAAPSGGPANNITMIAAIAGGCVLVLIIVGLVIYKKKSSGSTGSSQKSGPIDVNYSALMTDALDGQELDLHAHHHSPRESASVQV